MIDFVNREESLKSTEFGFMLLGELPEHKKVSDKDKATTYRIRQTGAKPDSLSKAPSMNKGSFDRKVDVANHSDSDRTMNNKPICFVCLLNGRNECHLLSSCNDFVKLNANE